AAGRVAGQGAVNDGQPALIEDRPTSTAVRDVFRDQVIGALADAAAERQVLQGQVAEARHVEKAHRRLRRDLERDAFVVAGTVDDDWTIDQKRRWSDAVIADCGERDRSAVQAAVKADGANAGVAGRDLSLFRIGKIGVAKRVVG